MNVNLRHHVYAAHGLAWNRLKVWMLGMRGSFRVAVLITMIIPELCLHYGWIAYWACPALCLERDTF